MHPMNKVTLLGLALVLMLVALPLLSWGTEDGRRWLWWLGLAILAAGGLIPPVARFAGRDRD
jgi:hypothetical protein